MDNLFEGRDIKAYPRPFPEWRVDPVDREEDAAYLFGYYLLVHCKDEVLAELPAETSPEVKAEAEKAVVSALYSITELLEGFWKLNAGPEHTAEFALVVRVRDANGNVAEEHEISPCKLDLPIGYWKWDKEREFR